MSEVCLLVINIKRGYIFYHFLFFIFFAHAVWPAGSQFPGQGLNPGHGSESAES